MVNSVVNHTYDLETPLVITPLRHALATGDQLGDRFDITVTQKGLPADLSGAGVTGYFIRTADGATVIITGSVSGNVASVTLPESCYAVPGRFTLTVKVSKGDVRHAVYVGEGAVLRSSTDTIIDPGHEIPDLDELLAMIAQIESAAEAAGAAASKANTAAAGADSAAGKADTAASAANTAANKLNNLTVSAHSADTASAAITEVSGHKNIDFGLPTGAAAGFGAITATVDNGVGTPSVQVTKGGPATATTLKFDFHNLKGIPGEGSVSSVWGAVPDETGDAKPEVGGRNYLINGLQSFVINQANFPNASMEKVGDLIRLNVKGIDGGGQGSFGVYANFTKINSVFLENLRAGDKIVISAEVRITAGNARIVTFEIQTMGSDPCFEKSITNINEKTDGYWRQYYRVISRLNNALSGEQFLIIYFANIEPNTVIEIRNVKLERGNVPTDWSPAPIDLIGGRNLLKNSGEHIQNNAYLITEYQYGNEKPVVGETYTVQIKGKLGEGKTAFSGYDSSDQGINTFSITEEDNRNDIYTKTIVWKRNEIISQSEYLNIFSIPNTVKTESTIEWIKLEKGVIPTDWTPAPEDKQDKIDLIGGRNLLTKSDPSVTDQPFINFGLNAAPILETNGFLKQSTYGGDYLSILTPKDDGNRADLEIGEYYTVSVTAYASQEIVSSNLGPDKSVVLWFLMGANGSQDAVKIPKLTTEPKRYYGTFKAGNTRDPSENVVAHPGSNWCLGLMYQNSAHDGITIYAKEFKLEKGVIPTDWTPAPEDLSGNGVPETRTINNKPLSSDITLTANDVNAVPTTRTVNNKPLTSDITLTASDVNAMALRPDQILFNGALLRLEAHDGVSGKTGWIRMDHSSGKGYWQISVQSDGSLEFYGTKVDGSTHKQQQVAVLEPDGAVRFFGDVYIHGKKVLTEE